MIDLSFCKCMIELTFGKLKICRNVPLPTYLPTYMCDKNDDNFCSEFSLEQFCTQDPVSQVQNDQSDLIRSTYCYQSGHTESGDRLKGFFRAGRTRPI